MPKAAPGFAGLAIGLTLVAIHLVGIQVTGVSVNPARSFGPAILVGGNALAQLWLFIVAPLAGGALGGLLYRFKVLKALLPDNRPQPPIDDLVGAPWIDEYNTAWKKEFPGYEPISNYVRDERGFWVWVTNTPQFDRNWFDEHGWQFPAAWITGPSQEFYKVGKDNISTIVALPYEDGTTTVPKDEVF